MELAHPVIAAEMVRLLAGEEVDNRDFPLRLISVRELQSHNTWLHNIPKLMTVNCVRTARIDPEDASDLGLSDGDPARITSRWGSIETLVQVTDEMIRGTVGRPRAGATRVAGSTR